MKIKSIARGKYFLINFTGKFYSTLPEKIDCSKAML
jgi:hypothetical protein